MTHLKPLSKLSTGRVDWSDPHLESLLRKSESWRLDNRGGYAPQEVQIHIGWGASIGKVAVLVWERDDVMVVEADCPIAQGEHVRVDRYAGDTVRTVWGVVVEGREGCRAEDRAQGIHVYWLHVR